MTDCDLVLERLTEDAAADIDARLAEHVRSCPSCREALGRAQGVCEGASVVTGLSAPPALVERLKTMRRLPAACEDAQELIAEALDGALDEARRAALLDHLRACPGCQAAWEAFATLREVGALTAARLPVRARLALHPSRRLATRRRGRVFDLRLATAAAYLVAAASIVLIGNPATVARASNVGLEKASLYTRAAVENRVESWMRVGKESLVVAGAWVEHQAELGWRGVRGLFRKEGANQTAPGPVVPSEDGGTR
ncbi:MAG: zf-HC2 domain-containing protein [Acidobacteriota bacterium]